MELGGDMFASAPTFSSEFIGIAAAIIILLIAFGSVIAMGLPIITALFGIGFGIAIITIASRFMAIPEFSTQLAAMIGIGVGIDYALLIVSRYRDALKDGLDPEQSVLLSLDTSGRAVVFAGITVVIALLGMFLMDLDFVRAVSASAILAVLLTMFARDHPSPGAPRLRRPEHRQAGPAAPQGESGRDKQHDLATLEPPDPGSPLARAH